MENLSIKIIEADITTLGNNMNSSLIVNGDLKIYGDLEITGNIIVSGTIKCKNITYVEPNTNNNTNITFVEPNTNDNTLNSFNSFTTFTPNSNFISGGFSGYNQPQPVKNIISNKKCLKNECRITLENIAENDTYYECADCKNCFKEDIMHLWLQENKICPMCRTNWSTNIIYINK
jgi:hypothetical protein